MLASLAVLLSFLARFLFFVQHPADNEKNTHHTSAWIDQIPDRPDLRRATQYDSFNPQIEDPWTGKFSKSFLATASNLKATASNLIAMVSNLLAMASNLKAMSSNLYKSDGLQPI